ncbi:hypothetical protein [Hymenobacter lapidarius]|nr:hypothetical protein [Hymenobacter lapidarius]
MTPPHDVHKAGEKLAEVFELISHALDSRIDGRWCARRGNEAVGVLFAALDAATDQLRQARQEREERDQRSWQNGFDYATAEADGRALVLADWVLWLTGRGEGRTSPASIEAVIGHAMALRGIEPDTDALTPHPAHE